MLFAFAFGVNKDVIEVHYHKNVKFFYQNLVDITLEYGQCIGQSKRYHLILKMAIASLQSRFPFITFPNLYSMVGVGQIELVKRQV